MPMEYLRKNHVEWEEDEGKTNFILPFKSPYHWLLSTSYCVLTLLLQHERKLRIIEHRSHAPVRPAHLLLASIPSQLPLKVLYFNEPQELTAFNTVACWCAWRIEVESQSSSTAERRNRNFEFTQRLQIPKKARLSALGGMLRSEECRTDELAGLAQYC